MFTKNILGLTTALATVASVSSAPLDAGTLFDIATRDTCQLSNSIADEKNLDKIPKELCEPHDEGLLVFSMYLLETEVPTFSNGAPNNGNVENDIFYLFDNTCKPIGVYHPGKCDIRPGIIEENFLEYVLRIDGVYMDVGKPSFGISYGAGHYDTKSKNCGCKDISHGGLAAKEACLCTFPVHGDPPK